MYRLFSLFWSGQRPHGFLDAHTRFEPVAPADHRRPASAARLRRGKFYAARSLPDTPEIARTLAWFVDSLAERTNVVLLDTGPGARRARRLRLRASRPQSSARRRG
jgi:hypothetical protein